MEQLHSLGKHLKIYVLFMKNCLQSQMEYRSNFMIMLVMESLYLVVRFITLLVIYDTGIIINGIPPDGMLLFFGCFAIMTGIFNAFFLPNFFSLSGHVRNGSLDIYMTKPLSLQFMVSLRQVEFVAPIPSIIFGITMLSIGWSRLGLDFSLYHVFGVGLLIAVGTATTYALFLLPQLLSFWIVRADAIVTLSDSAWDLNSVPMKVFNRWIQVTGITLFPIFLISNLPMLFLLKELTGLYLYASIIVPVLLFILLRVIWKMAIRQYSGASS